MPHESRYRNKERGHGRFPMNSSSPDVHNQFYPIGNLWKTLTSRCGSFWQTVEIDNWICHEPMTVSVFSIQRGGGRYVYIADVDAENCIPWWRVGVGYDFPYDDSTWFLYRIISVRQRYDLPHDSVFQKDKLPDVYNIFAIVVARLIDKLRSTLILGQTKKIK